MKTFMIVLIVLMFGIGTESIAFEWDQKYTIPMIRVQDNLSAFDFEEEYIIPMTRIKDEPLFRTKWTLIDSDFQNLKLKWKFDKLALDYDIKSGWLERTDVRFVMGIDPDRIPGTDFGVVFVIRF